MALSNTATPIYYGRFRDAVIRGEIPVCEEISMEMNRIDALIANPGVWYDDKAVNGFIKYCESELTLTNGDDLFLLDSFKLWAEEIFGWYYYIERSIYVPDKDNHGGHYEKKIIRKRLINKQYLIVARGAAKSMYASCIQNYFLNVDTSTSHQITTAPTMAQAEEVMSPFRTAITRARGPLYQFLTEGSLQNTTGSKANRVKLASTKKGIQNFLTGSLLEVRPMSIDKLQGLRVKVATVDEWLSGDVREDVVETLEQGAAKEQGGGQNDDYLIVAISSEGTVRNGSGDTIKMELMKILKGEHNAPHTSIFWYKLDSIDEVGDPSKWLKANPNLDKTVTYETYQEAVETAEKNPAKRNDILAKRFGLPMEGYTYYFTYEETLPHRKKEFWQMPCALGADLSQGDDFCAFTFLFPLSSGSFGVKTRNYITELTLKKLPLALRNKYEEFINEGSLIVMPGNILDMMQVYDDLDEFIIRTDYDVRCFGYDPYNAKEFVERWERENGAYGIEKVIQGAKTESVPLGELKKLAEERMLLFDEGLMTFTMGNCITIEDTNGNRKLYKNRYDAKIDAVAAMMDAFVAYKHNREAFE
ncbi:terminase TerL endonuclease subunit [uncultured Eubacterium sp.]|uniref:terminase TerL endonuclease subunit n=1 Tax=uncultured Eubacterium sp. TaxID=165185 RepID=UPI0025FFB575|nr:terminase TerL endonuclease subunit [uncultured Eubacterium sp.]